MLPLSGLVFPQNVAQLEQALRGGLVAFDPADLNLEMRGEWPAFERIAIDLTGARVPDSAPPEITLGAGSIKTAELEVTAKALRVEGAHLEMRLHARGVEMNFAHGPEQQRLLTIAAVKEGEVMLVMKKSELEQLVQTLAARAAAPHGVEIERTDLSVTASGPRRVDFTGEVCAQKMFMKTVIRMEGRLEIDEQLRARLLGLHCEGAGLMGALAANFLAPQLRRFEGKPIELASLAFDGLRLQDVALDASEPLRVTARLAPAIC